MSENLVNKWLKRDNKEDQHEKQDEEQRTELFHAIDNTVETAFAESLDTGIYVLAKLHHDLFASAVQGSENGRLALFYLRNNLNKLVFDKMKIDLGIFMVQYSKHWFRLFLILESRAQEYISWATNMKETSTNYRKILMDLKNLFKIDYLIIDEKSPFYTTLQLELQHIEEQVTVEAAKRLRHLLQTTLRMYLTNDSYKEKLHFIAFFISKSFEDAVTRQELIHEFAKEWFRTSLEFKRWFHIFIEKLQLHPEMELKMYKGYNWMKLRGKPLKHEISQIERLKG